MREMARPSEPAEPTREVVTWTLEMAAEPPRTKPLPAGVRVELARDISPEYARFLYALVGGPWLWTDRLGWSRTQWADDLAIPGTETWIAYGEGSPLGYVQLQPTPSDGGSVEVRYFGLVEQAIGRGLGGALLEEGVHQAWSLLERNGLGVTSRVWVHTCNLDGPAALANYRARGFALIDERITQEPYPAAALGSWVSTGGPA